jgi:3-oxoacyl-[acyl-carrier protein] reductase
MKGRDGMGQLDGRVAIVTGSGRGIGREIALRLARDGAKVVVNDIDEAPAAETIDLVRRLGSDAVACTGDVAAKDFGERIVKTAVDAFGDAHIVVNNAGYTWDSVIQKMSDEQWDAILDVHLKAPFRILRAFFAHLKPAVERETAQGLRVVRKVVNISSTSGVNGNAGQSNYSAAKAGINGLTKTLAKEWGRYHVTVNSVAFGYIQTRLTQPLQEGDSGRIEIQGREVKIGVQAGRIAALAQMIPLGRGGTPEEAAGSVYLFCSPDSDYVSGQTLVVTGGL